MKWLITGGAGFIGSNTAARLMGTGNKVVVFDNLCRRGAMENLRWLRTQGAYELIRGDVRNPQSLEAVFRAHRDIDVVLHLAAQVAVTTSVSNPREDFEINALGTFNVCEAVRELSPAAILLNASTNKVYGEMAGLKIGERGGRYEYLGARQGVSESEPLDFHSPYGCSKGSGDQYVRDYGRVYGLRTVTFRQSCIYGPRQFGVEDQGWVAWFAISAALGRGVTIYGDGRQVRDVLFVEDLIDCYLRAVERIERARGEAYNVGGGPRNAVSVLEVLGRLESYLGVKIDRRLSDWRPGDQRVFVCDITKAGRDLGWEPKVSVEEGMKRLVEWVVEHKSLFEAV